jgi:ketosteroid isomerase-like protein
MGVAEHKRSFEAFFAALGRADREALRALVTDDLVWVVPRSAIAPYAGRHEGAERILDLMLAAAGATFEPGSQHSEATLLVGEGDVVVGEVHMRARSRRGSTYDNWYCFLMEFRGGRIREIREHVDTAHAVRFFAGEA